MRFLPIDDFRRSEKLLPSIQSLEAHSHWQATFQHALKKKKAESLVILCVWHHLKGWITKSSIFGISFFYFKKGKNMAQPIKRYVQCMARILLKLNAKACAKSSLRDYVPEIFLSKTHHPWDRQWQSEDVNDRHKSTLHNAGDCRRPTNIEMERGKPSVSTWLRSSTRLDSIRSSLNLAKIIGAELERFIASFTFTRPCPFKLPSVLLSSAFLEWTAFRFRGSHQMALETVFRREKQEILWARNYEAAGKIMDHNG